MTASMDIENKLVTYHPPIPSRVSKANMFAFAEKQRKIAKISNGFDLPDLIRRNGGEIEYISAFDEDQTDAVVVEPDGKFLIRLSSHTSSLRDNFTLAHELGHKLVHWPKVRSTFPGQGMKATRSVDESDSDLVRCEWEANWFASAFLMPEQEFREAYALGVASDTFGVTQAAVNVRARALGI